MRHMDWIWRWNPRGCCMPEDAISVPGLVEPHAWYHRKAKLEVRVTFLMVRAIQDWDKWHQKSELSIVALCKLCCEDLFSTSDPGHSNSKWVGEFSMSLQVGDPISYKLEVFLTYSYPTLPSFFLLGKLLSHQYFISPVTLTSLSPNSNIFQNHTQLHKGIDFETLCLGLSKYIPHPSHITSILNRSRGKQFQGSSADLQGKPPRDPHLANMANQHTSGTNVPASGLTLPSRTSLPPLFQLYFPLWILRNCSSAESEYCFLYAPIHCHSMFGSTPPWVSCGSCVTRGKSLA